MGQRMYRGSLLASRGLVRGGGRRVGQRRYCGSLLASRGLVRGGGRKEVLRLTAGQ